MAMKKISVLFIVVLAFIQMNAFAQEDIPAYRARGYKANVSYTNLGLLWNGVETSHGYMFNDRFYVGGGAGLMLGALGQPVYTVQGFADAMAYWFPRKSTLTTGVRVGYIKNFSGDDLFHADVTVGWSWGLPSGHGLSANIGLSGSRGMSIIAIDLISLSLSLAPVLSVAYEF